MTKPYQIGQSVRLKPGPSSSLDTAGTYVVRRRNEVDSTEPNYVIESEKDHRMRREPHSRLEPTANFAGARS